MTQEMNRWRLAGILTLLAVLIQPVRAEEELWDYPAPEGDRDQRDWSFYVAPASQEHLPLAEGDRPQNVILMIGDGMGFNFVNLARLASVGADGRLHMERAPVTGILRTHAANALVTDSAAAGTALAAGVRTSNRRIGIGPDGTHYKSILRVAQDHDFRTAIVVDVTISHATPAPFAANVENRQRQLDIAPQMLANRVDVLMGGGRRYFLPQPQGRRQDGLDLLAEAREAGYSILFNREQLLEQDGLPVLGLFADNHMTTFAPEPTLAEMTRTSLQLLSQNVAEEERPGFFMMVEGGQIDWAGHANETDRATRQMLLFDMAVKEALEFAQACGNTLVIVTADHETGGLMIRGNFDNVNASWHTGGHSAADVPIYAFGPGALRFTGTRDITEIPRIIADLWGFEEFPVAIQE